MIRTITLSALVLVLSGALIGLVAGGGQEITLPPGCDQLTIFGEGFSLTLSQLDASKERWAEVVDESAKIKGPRQVITGNAGAARQGQEGQADDEKAIVNVKLFDEARSGANGQEDFGDLGKELLKWVENRASALINRVSRYLAELRQASPGSGNRIVLDILLLNTLVDLDNLIKEQLTPLIWVDRKLRATLGKEAHRSARSDEVTQFVKGLIDQNIALEVKLIGKNTPDVKWVTNTQAIRRVLHEQRFSEELGKIIVDYLAGDLHMMKRSVVYDINRQPKILQDGLYYANAVDRVPADFPFSAQDAISHGASD